MPKEYFNEMDELITSVTEAQTASELWFLSAFSFDLVCILSQQVNTSFITSCFQLSLGQFEIQ